MQENSTKAKKVKVVDVPASDVDIAPKTVEVGTKSAGVNTKPVIANKRIKRKSISYDKYGYLFVAPFFITFLIFQLYPIFFTFRTSLTDAAGWDKILDNQIIGFDNFAKIFNFGSEVANNFWKSLGNTVIMWVFNFVPQIGMALLLASWFTDSRMRLKFQGGFKVLIFMPNIITAATIGILFMALFGYPVAPVNTLLQQFGLLHEPFEFMRSTVAARGIVSFIQWWMWYGNTMIIMIAGILGINPALFEAALVDGCSSRQTFWKITLPLIRPILLYNLVTSLVGGLTMFDIPHLMTQGGPNYTTNTVARFIYQQGFETPNNFNMASAASVVLFGIIVICSLILSAIMKDRDVQPKKKIKGVGK
ncbi:MAG: sugar ABC transporter permease [Clostridia bacterium]|nr:sugar ABC transporter permease [Clostridia bacterium]